MEGWGGEGGGGNQAQPAQQLQLGWERKAFFKFLHLVAAPDVGFPRSPAGYCRSVESVTLKVPSPSVNLKIPSL